MFDPSRHEKHDENFKLRAPPVSADSLGAIGAIGALMNRVLQPHPLVVLGLNVWMGTAAGADELVEAPYR